MNLKRLMLFFCLEVHTQSNPNMPQNFIIKDMHNGLYLPVG